MRGKIREEIRENIREQTHGDRKPRGIVSFPVRWT